jgi:DNA-binding transcriptional LysR family regulator
VAVISAGDYFFPRLLVEFARRHPGVKLNLTVHNRAELLEQLVSNQTDLAVMVRPPQTRHRAHGLRAPPVRDRRTRPTTRWRAGAASPSSASSASRSWCASAARTPGTRWRTASARTWRAQRGDGDPQHRDHQAGRDRRHGRGFLSAHTISQELKAGSLVVLDVEGFPVMLNWYVVHRKNKRLPPVALAFKQFLLSDGAALIEQYLTPAA